MSHTAIANQVRPTCTAKATAHDRHTARITCLATPITPRRHIDAACLVSQALTATPARHASLPNQPNK